MAKTPGRSRVRFLDRYLVDEYGERWELVGEIDTRAQVEARITAGDGFLLHAVRGPVARATPREAARWWRSHQMEVLEEGEVADVDDPTWTPKLYRKGGSDMVVLTSWCVGDDQVQFH